MVECRRRILILLVFAWMRREVRYRDVLHLSITRHCFLAQNDLSLLFLFEVGSIHFYRAPVLTISQNLCMSLVRQVGGGTVADRAGFL